MAIALAATLARLKVGGVLGALAQNRNAAGSQAAGTFTTPVQGRATSRPEFMGQLRAKMMAGKPQTLGELTAAHAQEFATFSPEKQAAITQAQDAKNSTGMMTAQGGMANTMPVPMQGQADQPLSMGGAQTQGGGANDPRWTNGTWGGPGAVGAPNGPVSQTTSPGMMGPNGQPMIPPGPNQITFAQQQANEASGATPTGQAPSGLPPTDRGALIANSPAYQFRFGQGEDAIQRSAAAKGTLLNGGTLKELTNFGQGLASTEYDNEFRRLADITRLGQAGAGQLGGYGSGYGGANMDITQQQGNNTIGLGDASAAGTIADANATNAAGSVVAKNAGQIDWSKLFKRKPQGPAGPTSAQVFTPQPVNT